MRRFIATGFWLASVPFSVCALALVSWANQIAGTWSDEEDDDE